jgi:hypothetical protein
MFLHLRWYGIDIAPYQTRWVNAVLPVEYAKRLRQVSKKFKIPYSEIFRREIFRLKKWHWERHNYWEAVGHPPEFRKHSVREELEEEFKYIRERGFTYWRIELEQRAKKRVRIKQRTGNGVRICLRLTEGDLRIVKILLRKETIGDCLKLLIPKESDLQPVTSSADMVPVNRFEIEQYRPHRKITFGIRTDDYRRLNEFMDRYGAKYHPEKLTRSEVVIFAYHLFKRATWKEQQKSLKDEGKKRGSFKKISISFSNIGYRCPMIDKPETKELRAALYYVLNSKKFNDLVDKS